MRTSKLSFRIRLQHSPAHIQHIPMTHIACESPPRVASPSNSSTHAQQLHTYSHLHTEHTTSIPASPTTSLTHIVPPLHLVQAVSLPCHLTTPHPQLLLQPPLKSPPHPYRPTSMSLRASSSLATSVCPPCTHQCCYHHQHHIHILTSHTTCCQ